MPRAIHPGDLDLAVEASTRRASLALAIGERIVSGELEPDARHASDLLQHLVRMLAENDLHQNQLTRITCGIGPGSFTGLRVAAAVALGLARALDVELVAVPSTSATAWAVLSPGQSGTVVLDARGGAAYVASYTRTEESLQTVLEPTRVPLNQAATFELTPGLLIGDPRASEWFGIEGNPGFQLAGEDVLGEVDPRAENLLVLGRHQWLAEGPSPNAKVRPFYLADFGA